MAITAISLVKVDRGSRKALDERSFHGYSDQKKKPNPNLP